MMSEREVEVMSELARLSGTRQEYREVVRSAVQLVASLMPGSLLCLSIAEHDDVGHYAQVVSHGIEPAWAESAGQQVADVVEEWIQSAGPGVYGGTPLRGAVPPAVFVAFPARTRSGRPCFLVCIDREGWEPSKEEEQRAARLAEQLALVLDHVLLLEALERQEVEDSVTGIPNQRQLLQVLSYELQRHRHFGKVLALLLLDVDGLATINRSYGRQYGSHILRRLAGLISEIARPIDIVARYGMDEFALVLPETGEEGAEECADRLRERLMEAEFAGGAVAVTVGVVHARPEETLTPEGLLRRGEQALYEAKRQGRERAALLGDWRLRR